MQYKTRFLFPVRWSCFRNFDENGFCWTFNTTSRSLFNSIFHWHYMFQIYIYKNFMSELRIIKLLRIQLCWINAKWFQGSNRILFAQLIVWLMFQNSIQNHHNQSYLSFLLNIYSSCLPRSDHSEATFDVYREGEEKIFRLSISMNVFCFNQFISI